MTKANDPACPVMQPTGTFSGMTIREQMALTLTAAMLSSGCGVESIRLGVDLTDNLISQLNKTAK